MLKFLTLCDPMDIQPARLLCPWGFSRQEYQSGLPCPPPGDLPNPTIKPRSPTMHTDSLWTEPPGKLEITKSDNTPLHLPTVYRKTLVS